MHTMNLKEHNNAKSSAFLLVLALLVFALVVLLMTDIVRVITLYGLIIGIGLAALASMAAMILRK